jgi:hypothetical protein
VSKCWQFGVTLIISAVEALIADRSSLSDACCLFSRESSAKLMLLEAFKSITLFTVLVVTKK